MEWNTHSAFQTAAKNYFFFQREKADNKDKTKK